MVISEQQQAANRRNAQHSTGPATSEGKAAIRFNALKYGLRTRSTIINGENAAAYSQLWDELEADWQPQNRTERCLLETMVTSQWLLARAAENERRIYDRVAFGEKQLALLACVAKQRAQLERSFRTAIADLRLLRNERQPRPRPHLPQPAPGAEPAPALPSAAPQAPPPAYLMSRGNEVLPFLCSSITLDSR